MDAVVNVIDSILTVIFWLPAKLLGVEKCSKCTIRYRWLQFLLLITFPLKWVPFFKGKRDNWKNRTRKYGVSSLKRVSIQDI